MKDAGVQRLVDIRLRNSSQLAGFTKREDLPYFLDKLCGVEYVHEPLLAPTQELLTAYRKKRISWQDYEQVFLALMAERKVEEKRPPDFFLERPTVLLCTETTAERCHRRLVLEYLYNTCYKWDGLEIVHL